MDIERVIQTCRKCGKKSPGFIVNGAYFACSNCTHPVVIQRYKRAWDKRALFDIELDYRER